MKIFNVKHRRFVIKEGGATTAEILKIFFNLQFVLFKCIYIDENIIL